MPNFLLIETAAAVCSVAIANENGIISIRENGEGQQHATLITVFIDEALKESKLNFRQTKNEHEGLSAVVVSAGPGSYTGLRIGVSAAKGICFGLQIPLIAIDSLQSIAGGFSDEKKYTGNICSVIDARRDEVYFGIWNKKTDALINSRSAILNDEFLSIINSIEAPISFVGNGAEKVKIFLSNVKHQYHSQFKSSAKYLLPSAIKKFREKDFVDVAYFEPNYIKPFYFAESKKV